jgi:membrane-bound lytic murein transglycosylase A
MWKMRKRWRIIVAQFIWFWHFLKRVTDRVPLQSRQRSKMFRSSVAKPALQGGIGLLLALVVGGSDHRAEAASLEPASSEFLPFAADDLDRASLITAVQQSLTALRKKDGSTPLAFGHRQLTVTRMQESLELFLTLLRNETDLSKALVQHFDTYQVSSSVLFTGYHEPILNGSLVRTERYRYPLYRPPDATNSVPSLSRAEIDGQEVLGGKGYELVWLDDPVDRFFLHIQGSGMIRLPGGTQLRVGYAANNGKPYQSIGKMLLERGELQPGNATTLAIRRYLKNHPEERDAILSHNPRYIFFKLIPDGPFGSLGVPLTPGRSLAVDPTVYPGGGLAFIHTKRPVLKHTNRVTWKEFFRFVLLQDTGAAITGPARADLFWGSAAEAEAGVMAQRGELYLLVKKP